MYDYWLSELQEALGNSRRMTGWLQDEGGRCLLEGMEDFLEFSEDLDGLLASMVGFPLHRGLFWLNFGYWYGGGGERMRDVADWIAEAISSLPITEPVDEDVAEVADKPSPIRRMREVIERLTDFDGYPARTIEVCAKPLVRWCHYAIAAAEPA
jgi:hypothetical protein